MKIPQFDSHQIDVLKTIALNILPYETYHQQFHKSDHIHESRTKRFIHKIPHQFMHHSGNHNIYLYGPVGRGKTCIMEYIYTIYPHTKQRFHFDHLSAELYHTLDHMNIKEYVRTTFKQTKLLWIDELQIYDITTAIIIKKLIQELCTTKHLIMMTGNVDPIDFYKNGLNREQFENFIPYFYTHFKCINIQGDTDYRQQSQRQEDNANSQHFWLTTDTSNFEMYNKFQSLSSAEQVIPYTLILNMRNWKLASTLSQTVFLEFDELAHDLHSSFDYKLLVNKFPIIFLVNVPIFNSLNREECKRFMSFIDMLYDHSGVLYMEACVNIENLFQDDFDILPFQRTASRLTELLGQ